MPDTRPPAWTMTRRQCRAARGLLGLSQRELADISGVSLRTVVAFELGESKPYRVNLAAMRTALERSGVEFVRADTGYAALGPGVRMRETEDA